MSKTRRNPRRRSDRALALVEVIVSSGITAVLFVAAVVTAGSARTTRQAALDRITARHMARNLLIEMSKLPYRDPTGLATDALGIDSGETATNRATFDDIDDYNGYTQSPPADLAGTTLMDGTWRWTVTVSRVNGLSGGAATSETGYKQIVIVVNHGNKIAAKLTNIRTAGGG